MGLLAQLDLTEPARSWDGGSGMVSLIVLLIFMVAGLAAVLFWLKRGGFTQRKGEGNLEILETKMLGGRQFLVVGDYQGERFLLGVCPGKIDFLCKLSRGDNPPKADFDHALREASQPNREVAGR